MKHEHIESFSGLICCSRLNIWNSGQINITEKIMPWEKRLETCKKREQNRKSLSLWYRLQYKASFLCFFICRQHQVSLLTNFGSFSSLSRAATNYSLKPFYSKSRKRVIPKEGTNIGVGLHKTSQFQIKIYASNNILRVSLQFILLRNI